MKRLIQLSQSSALRSLKNKGTAKQTLYVMQNDCGLIKIGRSHNSEQRRRILSRQLDCAIQIVALFTEAGHFEELLHNELACFAVAQEWFDGTSESRFALAQIFEENFDWPYAWNAQAAGRWSEVKFRADATVYWSRIERETVRALKSAVIGEGRFETFQDGSLRLDEIIAHALGYAPTLTKGLNELFGTDQDTGKKIKLPNYTRSEDAAKTLWPDDTPDELIARFKRPVQICMEALCYSWNIDPDKLTPV